MMQGKVERSKQFLDILFLLKFKTDRCQIGDKSSFVVITGTYSIRKLNSNAAFLPFLFLCVMADSRDATNVVET